MFGASFVDSWPLSKAKISQEIIDEVCHHTPGYESWQQEDWIACCEDACEFHGDADAKELVALGTDDRMRIANEMGWSLKGFDDVLKNYVPKGDPAIYLFRCRHCRAVHCNYDCS